MFIETVIIAAVVAVGLIAAGKAIITARASRRPSHHLATDTGARPVPPTIDIRPPEG